MFNKYPYTNFHEINLDWLIRKVMEVIETMDNFIELNTIKVADPINWSINTAYDRLTIVVHEDSEGVKAYLSIRDVPSGTALSNENYWTLLGVLIESDVISGIETELEAYTDEVAEALRVELKAYADGKYDELTAQIQALRDGMPKVNHNRMTYYIDASGGSDDNDGLTQATAFKTFDRFMLQAEEYSALHGRIISAGNYVYSYNEIANIDLDVQATVGGVVLTLTSSVEDGRFTFYNGRFNIYGAYGVSVPMEVRLDGNGIIYMIGCTSAIHDLEFSNTLRVYGGECWLENVTFRKLYTRNSFARLYNCVINNNDPTESAVRLLNGITIIMGQSSVVPLIETSADGTALVSAIGGQISIIPSGLILNEQTNYYYGLEATNTVVVIADTLLQLLSTYSVNGNKYYNTAIPSLTSN